MTAAIEKDNTESRIGESLDFYVIDGRSYRLGKEAGKIEGVEEYCKKQFISVYDLKRTAQCAELFIRKFYEQFKDFAILQARIGMNQSHEPTAFFVTNIPKEMISEICKFERDIEFEFQDMSKGNDICIWSVSGNIVQNEIDKDFPFLRRAVSNNA